MLGPLLDVIRGDAEIVPKKRVIDTYSVKVGDQDKHERSDGTVVLNRLRFGNTRVPRKLVLGDFKLGVASRQMTQLLEEHRDFERPETHIDVSEDNGMLQLIRSRFLPKYLLGKKLPGIALRDFYLDNPHHIPEYFSGIVLFWGTVCKNSHCYYVPGLHGGSEYGRRICSHRLIDGKEELFFDEFATFDNNAAVFI